MGELIPDFAARTTGGRTIVRREFKGRQHLIVCFAAAGAGEGGRTLTTVVDAEYAAWRAERAEALVILPPDAATAPGATAVPIILDEDGALHARFGIGEGAALIIADRYGEVVLRHEVTASDADAELPLGDALPTLAWLETRCSL